MYDTANVIKEILPFHLNSSNFKITAKQIKHGRIQPFDNNGFPPFQTTLNNRFLSGHSAPPRIHCHRFKWRKIVLAIFWIRQRAKVKRRMSI